MVLPTETLSVISRHAEKTYPQECCGLVVQDSTGKLCARPGQNLSAQRDAFELDPGTILETRRNEEVITGLYHSHCDGPAFLSRRDLDALIFDGKPGWPGVDVFIASVTQGHCVCVRRFVWSASTKTYEAEDLRPW